MTGDAQPTNEDLRRLEARLQAVDGRFSTADRRHDSMSSKLGIAEDQWKAFAEWTEHRVETHDDRFEATDMRIDIVYDQLAARIDQVAKRQVWVFCAAGGATVVAVILAIAAIAAVLVS